MMPNETNLVKELVLITVIVDFGKENTEALKNTDYKITGKLKDII